VPIEAFDELGALVPGIDLEPLSVRVRADVARQLAYATLPVVPELSGDPASGYRIDTVTVSPSVVTVSGEDPAIRQLESIATEPVDVSGRQEELIIDVPFVLPQEVTVPAGPTVTVTVSFAPAEGSRSLQIGTALVGTRSDRSYRMEEPSIQVLVAGPLAIIHDIDTSQLVAEVPVAGLEVGAHDVIPTVRLPDGLEAARTVPEAVRVTVEQLS
jgi:YbbR domain-containing protein